MKRNHGLCIGVAVLLATVLFIVAGCGDPGGTPRGDPELPGSISISPNSGVTTGATLTAVYSGSETVSYQWNKDGTAIAGAAGQTYSPAEAGSYTVTVSAAGYQSKTSAAVAVTGNALPVLPGSISINPDNNVATGATLAAVYSGSESVSYRWNKDGAAIAGAAGQTYTAAEAGSYTVTVSAAGFQSKTSAAVTVTGTALLVLPGNIGINPNSGVTIGATLTAAYSGSENVSYRWNKDGIAIAGAAVQTYIPAEAGSYTVTVSAAGFQSKTSAAVTVTGDALPEFPGNVYITSSGSLIVGLPLFASYKPPYGPYPANTSCQWNKDGSPIPGATGDKYTPTQTGSYTVTVSAPGYRSKTSSPAVVTDPGAVSETINNVTIGLLADVLAALPDNTPYTPHTIVFSPSLIINNDDTDPNGAWASVNKATWNAKKYVILDLSACTAVNNTISGYRSSQRPNAMNIITYYINGIILPESLTTIGSNAFENIGGLVSITIPASVTSIEDGAFLRCAALTSITIPASVTSIGDNAFYGCTALTSITIPASVTSIGDNAFTGCTALTSITIPASVTSIGDYAFIGCTALTSVTIPEGVTDIGGLAFVDCTALTSITIPASVTGIGDNAFLRCTALADISVNPANSAYSSENGALFNKAKTTLLRYPEGKSGASYAIPPGVTDIEDRAFSGCSALTSITIPEGVTAIGESAFKGCSALTSVTIPASVTSIGDYAFGGMGINDDGCIALTSVTFAEGSNIAGEQEFGISAFPQGSDGMGGNNLRMRYLTSSPKAGAYTRPAGGDTWTKQ
jgi:hypothetical protein